MSEIRNCPFCGGEATIEHDYDFASHPWYYVECDECGCKTESYVDENGKLKAIESWNTRVPMQKIVERLEERIVEMKKAVCLLPTQQYEHSLEIVKEEGGLND